MKAKAFAAIAAAILFAALVFPAATMARTAGAARQGHPTVIDSLDVTGTNGFQLGVSLTNRSRLAVSAVAAKGPSLVVTDYKLEADQPRGSDQIKASLGKLGRIEMRFVPESVHEEEPLLPICKGERDMIEEGHFVGLFEFHGEHGYTRARVKRAPGSVLIVPAHSCHKPAKNVPHQRGPRQREGLTGRALAALAKTKEATKAKPHALILNVRTGDPTVQFFAARISGPDKHGKELALDSFIAGGTRERGRIREESSVLDLLIPGPYFKVPDLARLTSEVVLEPPAPFLGSATLRRESSDKVSWDGDLRLNLPGFGVVPLAKPAAHVSLCADSGCHLKK